MRSVGFLLNGTTVKEVLPKSYKITSKIRRRKMFYAMLNMKLSKEAKIPLDNCSDFNKDIRFIAVEKIMSFFQCYKLRPETTKPPLKLLVNESIEFNNFFRNFGSPFALFLSRQEITITKKFTTRDTRHPALELMSLLFAKKEGVLLDLNEMFTQTVFRRIKPGAGSVVSMENGYIHIDTNGLRTRVHPRWKRMAGDKIKERYGHIDDGFRQLRDENIDACYLVYPKMDDFTKHIIVQQGESEFLKVIPYSFTFCARGEEHNV
jgi:hypothetical protein